MGILCLADGGVNLVFIPGSVPAVVARTVTCATLSCFEADAIALQAVCIVAGASWSAIVHLVLL